MVCLVCRQHVRACRLVELSERHDKRTNVQLHYRSITTNILVSRNVLRTDLSGMLGVSGLSTVCYEQVARKLFEFSLACEHGS